MNRLNGLNRINRLNGPPKGGGISWSSYWTTLITATVENAAPTHVVLTFPTAQTSLGASDFTVTGFTISSASWTDAVLTLILSSAVMIYHGDLTVTFGKTSETATVTNNVADDGTTKVWWDFTDATLKTSIGGHVQQVNDKSANALNLTAGATTRRPSDNGIDGVTGDGSDDRLENSTASGIDGNCTIYIVAKINTWEQSKTLLQSAINTHATDRKFTLLGWNPAATLIDAPADDTWFLITAISRNVGNSSIEINNGTVISGANPHCVPAFYIFGTSNFSSCWNPSFKEIIVRNGIDGDATKTIIKSYLNTKHEVFF